jgi:hypothetical protein
MLASYASFVSAAVKNTVVTAAVIATEVVKPALNRVLPESALPPLVDIDDGDDGDEWMDEGDEGVIKALREAAEFKKLRKERQAQEIASLDAVKTALTSTVELAPVELAPVELAPVELAPVELAPVELAPVDSDDESDGERDPMTTAGFLQPDGMLRRNGTLVPWRE